MGGVVEKTNTIVQPGKFGPSTIKQESVEYTLPTLPIDANHNIDYYYPYFYKTHLVDYYDPKNSAVLTNVCPDFSCELCDINLKTVCKQCKHGYYLSGTVCMTSCPINTVADIFKRTCNILTSNSKKLTKFRCSL